MSREDIKNAIKKGKDEYLEYYSVWWSTPRPNQKVRDKLAAEKKSEEEFIINAIHSALPAQREVRYLDSMANPNNYTDKSKGDYARGWNAYRESMKKLNGG